jgi:hypothetical protein
VVGVNVDELAATAVGGGATDCGVGRVQASTKNITMPTNIRQKEWLVAFILHSVFQSNG